MAMEAGRSESGGSSGGTRKRPARRPAASPRPGSTVADLFDEGLRPAPESSRFNTLSASSGSGVSGSGSGRSTAKDRQEGYVLQPYVAPAEEEKREESKPLGWISPMWADSAKIPVEERLNREVTVADGGETAALKGPEQGKRYRARRTREMTWERYNALSDIQRAAIDFNTMLVEARNKDLRTDYETPTADEQKKYDETVERIFGADGGSETFAPETVAALESIDLVAKGQDLDDFLGLKVAITPKDLKALGKPVEAPDLSDPTPLFTGLTTDQSQQVDQRTETLQLQERLAARTAAMTRQMAEANQMLQNFRASASAARDPLALSFGGTENDLPASPGFGPSDPTGNMNLDDFIRQQFTLLTQKNVDPENVFADITNASSKSSAPEKERRAFVRYVDDMTRNIGEYDIRLGGNAKRFRSMDEVRRLVGLPPVSEQGGRDGTR